MTATPPEIHRIRCQIHALQRGLERGMPLDCADIVRIEAMIERMRPAFAKAGQDRYKLRMTVDGRRVRVLYDARLGCLVTLWVVPA